MVKLPVPPWARKRERCPNCLAKLPDDRAVVCDKCGYQLRLPRAALLGLVLIAAAVGNFFASVFGGYPPVFQWPGMPFGLKVPFLESPTPADLQQLAFWVGVVLLSAGIVATYAGAYAVRRRADQVLARGPG